MKIVYIFERRHYYVSDDKRFGIQYFIKQGYDVEVWSSVYWTYGFNISIPQNLHDGELIYINNERDIERELERVKNTKCCFIVYPYYLKSKSSYIIRKKIKRSGFDFYNLAESLDLVDLTKIPTKIELAISGLKKQIYMLLVLLRQVLFPTLEWKEKLYIVYRLWGPILVRSKANFLPGKIQLSYFQNPWEVFEKRNIFVPHMDYGNYLEELKDSVRIQKNYAVYIDEYEIGHSDFEKSGVLPAVKNKEQYFKELKIFFDRIEKELKLKVIIAAHPKAEYDGDEFGGREIRYLETARLIKNAKLVLYEYGTSISFILLFKKDFIHFCMSHHFKGHMVDSLIKEAKVRLKTSLLNISELDAEINWQNYIKSYQEEYDAYVEQFIVPHVGMKKDMFMIMDDIIQKGSSKHIL